jgi:beta-lactamase superfamily II metal-dependent hydrolase
MLRVLRLSLVLLFLSLPSWGEQLELRFLDVGQGDAILIREGGKTALVDAGHSARIVPQLRALGIDTIDLVVASHNHADHIGGMHAVLGGTKVRYYLDNGLPQTTATYRRTIDAVVASGAQYLRASERAITLGTAQLHVLPPPPPSRSQNDSSVGLLVEYGAFRALLTGDSEVYELHYWLTRNEVPRVQVVKVAHHGSSNGTTTEWVQATRPDVAVISMTCVAPQAMMNMPKQREIQLKGMSFRLLAKWTSVKGIEIEASAVNPSETTCSQTSPGFHR